MRFKIVSSALLLAATMCLGQQAPASQPSRDPKLPTLWIIGDSTVKNGTKGQKGWGEVIAEQFDTSRINIENRAIGGRSSRTFRTDGRWEKILSEAKPGDFVLMQFGHNDPAPLSGDNRERGTIRGMGDEIKEVTLTLGANNGKQETVHTFAWYMKQYVEEAKAKGMNPIVCSYVPRCPRAGTATQPAAPIKAPEQLDSYALWAKQTAENEHVSFIDLLSRILTKYSAHSADEVKTNWFTPADFTHTNEAGARLNAETVVEGIKDLDTPLKSYLKQ